MTSQPEERDPEPQAAKPEPYDFSQLNPERTADEAPESKMPLT